MPETDKQKAWRKDRRTVWLSKQVLDRLENLDCKKGDTYSDLVERLLNKLERKRVQKDA